MSLPPLSVYVHFPWCVSKCPYCDFNSFGLQGALPEEAYLQGLERDLQSQVTPLAGRSIHSVFMGGGTPSLFTPDAIARVLASLRAVLAFEPGTEITLEANPGTIERGRFAGYRDAGVNRVSLGAQSFDGAQLKRLGRIHAVDDIARAVDELRAAGIDNFNLDLMFALPDQSLAGALHDVDTAIALQPAHLSHYQLTLEPGTVFAHAPPPLPAEDLAWDMQVACQQRLADAGFAQYEVSAYARAGRQCVHNLNYWRFGDYLGLGAGAHGKLSARSTDNALTITRTRQQREPRRYQWLSPQAITSEVLLPDALPFEFMLNALRLRAGFDESLFEARTGLGIARIEPALASAVTRGLLQRQAGLCRPSELGYRFLNDVIAGFIDPAPGPISLFAAGS
ncbi:MAG: radical SAM family heme chaperone HemW [Steroidobacteraceae bacterium]